MNTMQANECAAYLFRLFPSLNSAQVQEWASEFEQHDLDDVREAVQRHHRDSPDGFVKARALMDSIRLAERARKLREDARRRAQEDEEDRQRVQRIDATIAAMRDTELEIRKAEVLAQLPCGKARALLEGRDPRRSAWLKGLIFERMNDAKLAEVL